MSRVLLAAFMFAVLSHGALFSLAQEAKTEESSKTESPSAIELERLTEQLDAPEYADRQAASQRLAELGNRALPALEKAAQGESREAASRAFDLLKKLHDSADPNSKAAAKEALGRLAESKSAPAARRAKEMLDPTKTPETPNNPAVVPPAVIRPGIGGIRIAGGAIAGGKRISIRNENGVKTIESTEEGKSIKIHDDPNNGIKIEVTEKKDGKEETKKFEAKDADDLKKNHPEIHKEYEALSQGFGGGGIRVQIGGAAIPVPIPGAVPVPAPALPNDPEFKKSRAASLERSIQSLDRAIKNMEAQKKKLEEEKAELEKP